MSDEPKSIPDLLATEPPKTKNCAEHGDYESRNVFGRVWSGCPYCAIESAEKQRADDERRQQVDDMIRWTRLLGGAGIPARFQDRSLKSYRAESEGQRRALAFAEAYSDDFDAAMTTGKGALFVGGPGTGKTHLAVGIGLRIMHRDGRRVLFTTVMRAIRRIRNTWGRDSEERETDAVAALTSPDLLILDELGVQVGTENEKLLIFDLLNERYEARLPTILLSNLALEDAKRYLGERIYDRMREDGGEVVVFDWASHRGCHD